MLEEKVNLFLDPKESVLKSLRLCEVHIFVQLLEAHEQNIAVVSVIRINTLLNILWDLL